MTTNHLANGQHLLVDACEVNEEIEYSASIENFFDELIEILGMKRLGPFVIEFVDELQNKGWSAVQMITTSSITFHADEIGMGFYLDVFSCKPFDEHLVLTLVHEYFEPKKIRSRNIARSILEANHG